MRITNKPTDYIMVKAFTNSEWDSVDVAIINIAEKHWQAEQLSRMEKTAVFKDDKRFYGASFWENPDKWVILGPDMEEEMDLGEEEWSFVEITEEELDALATPDNKLKYGDMRVSVDDIKFICLGEYTSEEFWTADIPLKTIIHAYENQSELA